MDLVNFVTSIPGVGPYVPYLLALGALCAVVATILPPPRVGGSRAYAVIYQAVNWIALNIGHAKNAVPPRN